MPAVTITINGLCKIKMVDEAVKLFKEMGHKIVIPNTVTYSTLIDGLRSKEFIQMSTHTEYLLMDYAKVADLRLQKRFFIIF